MVYGRLMRDRYIEAVLHYLRHSERAEAREQLQQRFDDGGDERATIRALGHPFACSLSLTKRPKAVVRAEYRLHYRKSLGVVIALSLIAALALLLIPPLFRPIRITREFLLTRALLAISISALSSATLVTLLFVLFGSLGVRLPMPRWDEAALAHLLGEDELMIEAGALWSELIFSLLCLALLFTLSLRPEWVRLQGHPLFTASARGLFMAGLPIPIASIPLWVWKRRRRTWSRPLFVWDTIREVVGVLYTVVLLTRWNLYTPAFLASVGEERLKIIVTALSLLWILLTILERANDGYTVFTGTAPGRGS